MSESEATSSWSAWSSPGGDGLDNFVEILSGGGHPFGDPLNFIKRDEKTIHTRVNPRF